MQFLFPYFLIASLTIAIPIVIHLFYFRRFKQVYFTNVRFLKEVKEESSARSKLRNLLVLLARCLALLALVFAFAQPFLPQQSTVKQGEKAVSIYVDNSFSMSSLSEDAPIVEKAKQRAREIVNAYAADDRFQIITSEMEGRQLHLVSKEDALGLIEEIKISPTSTKLSEIFNKQKQVLQTAGTEHKIIYEISDFQKKNTDISAIKDTVLDIKLVPLSSVEEKNIAIDSAWFLNPVQLLQQPNSLLVKVTNYTNEKAEGIRISLQHDGQSKPVGSLDIPANSTIVDTVNITVLKPGWQEAKLSITDYPVQFDDHYFLSFNVSSELNLLVINDLGTNRYLDAAFKGASFFKVTNEFAKNINYSKLPNYKLVILNDLKNISSGLSAELRQYALNGGNILVFPAADADLNSYKLFLNSLNCNELSNYETANREVSSINLDAALFNDVFETKKTNLKLPSTQGNYKILGGRGEEKLMTYRDGNTFITQVRQDKGNLYVCAAPLEESKNTLVKNGEIFVPMLFKMAITNNVKQHLAYIIGKDDIIEENLELKEGESAEKNYIIKGEKGEFIPQQKMLGSKMIIGINQQIKEAGFYKLQSKQDTVLSKYAFNFDRNESQLDFLSTKDLKSYERPNLQVLDATASANFTGIVTENDKGITLWKWCIALALIFLAIEALLIRFWKG